MTIREKDPIAFLRMPISITLEPREREVLVQALEAYFFAELLKERSLPIDYTALRSKLLAPPQPKA